MGKKKRASMAGMAVTPVHEMSRATDPVSSHVAARSAQRGALVIKRELLAAYAYHRRGLTDLEAAQHTGRLAADPGWYSFTRRCSELRRDGYIVHVGEFRQHAEGRPRMVCEITAKGLALLEGGA